MSRQIGMSIGHGETRVEASVNGGAREVGANINSTGGEFPATIRRGSRELDAYMRRDGDAKINALQAELATHRHGNITRDGRLSETGRVVITDGGAFVDVSNVTALELLSLSHIDNNVQNQLDSKALAFDAITNWEIEAMMEDE